MDLGFGLQNFGLQNPDTIDFSLEIRSEKDIAWVFVIFIINRYPWFSPMEEKSKLHKTCRNFLPSHTFDD